MESESLKYFLFASIISADNDEFGLTEDQKQEIISRYGEFKNETPDWEYVLQTIPDEGTRKALVELLGY